MKIRVSKYTDDGYKRQDVSVDDYIERVIDRTPDGEFLGKLVNRLMDKGLLNCGDLQAMCYPDEIEPAP